MSERTIEVPSPPPRELPADPGTPSAQPSLAGLVRRYVWWLVGIAIVLFSAALVHWARTRPSYDAYGWMVWGYQTLRLNLDLGGAPSWKPLAFLFTVPYAVFGTHLELRLWMVTAVSLAFAGCVIAGRIAYFVVAGDRDAQLARGGRSTTPLARVAPWLAAVFAGATLLALNDNSTPGGLTYLHYVLSVQSDPVIVTFVLAGVDAHLRGRKVLAFWFGVIAGLGRPEAWCLLGPYTVYLWLCEPRLRRMLVITWLLILFMWFGVPTITNDKPFVSAQLAENSPRLLRGDKVTGTLGRFFALYDWPLWLAAGASIAWALYRRSAVALALAGAGALWVITEIAFALKGWPGLPRYMFEGGALFGVVGGIGFGWLMTEPLPVVGTLRATRFVGPLLAAALVVALIPYAHHRYHQEHLDLISQHERTNQINALQADVKRIGGSKKIRECGQPVIDVEWASILAFNLHMNVGYVGYRIDFEIGATHGPLVVFGQVPYGWESTPYRTPLTPACHSLRAALIFPPGHGRGELVHT